MNKPSQYLPQPIDTAHIELPPAVQELTELLARNAHEVWARNRLAEGWRWGPERDDARKEHPCLVPYEALPESEKEFDRAMAVGTLKTILALGFQLEHDKP
ncbi:MAG: RyR domain-containing protein [Anaerolineales bacterium]|jgi:hypothetical protein|nr:RyR domain-containing protein [Anaerolineales bacterium]